MSTRVFADVRLLDGDGLGGPVSVISTDDRITAITTEVPPEGADEVIDGAVGHCSPD